MEFIKTPNGNILIKKDGQTVTGIAAVKPYIHLHPRNDNSILISNNATNQNESEALQINVAEVDKIGGVDFNGTREDLIEQLTDFFNNQATGGDGSGFSGSWNDLTDKPTLFSGEYNDLTGSPDLSLLQPKLSLGGSIFSVWAEESADLGNGAFEWAYGNGNDTPNGMGVVLVFPCKLIGLALTLEGNATCEVEAYKNTSSTGKKVVTSNNKKGYTSFANDPIDYAAGDVINFRTILGSAASNGGVVTAWFLAV